MRVSIEIPIDVTHNAKQREDILARRARGERLWTPWKQVMPSWPIAKLTYQQLSPVWTNNAQWTFDKP